MFIKMLDGSEPKTGQTVTFDHGVTEFKIVIRHLGTANENSIKNLLQQKFEVIKVEEVETTTFCSSCRSDFL